MKNKLILTILIGSFFVGCGQPEITDPCEIDYQKCSTECKVSMLNEADWKKTACEAKCKTIFAGCKTKQKTVEGYHYVKEKVNKELEGH